MITLTSNDVITFEKACQDVLKLDPKMRFVGIINHHGRLQTFKKRSDTELLVDDIEKEMLFMELALRVRMRQEFDMPLGTVDFTVSQREKITVMSIPYKDHILYISTDNGVDLSITHKILELIRGNRS